MKTTSPEREIEIERIERALVATAIGETLTYEAASQACGRDVRRAARFSLMSACRRVEKRDGIRFATVRATGIKRLATDEIPGIGANTRARIRRAARRGYDRLTGIKANDITTEVQARIDAERSLLGAISSLTDEAARKTAAKASAAGPVPIGQIVAGMRV